ncbi:MAG: hypothetical protein V1735_03000 [Nanoarchaeota archaeon]
MEQHDLLASLYEALGAYGLEPVEHNSGFTYLFRDQGAGGLVECLGVQLRQDLNPGLMAYPFSHVSVNQPSEQKILETGAFGNSPVPVQSVYLNGVNSDEVIPEDLVRIIDALLHGGLRVELQSVTGSTPLQSDSWGAIKALYR